jgi:TetR/AcrR family transcriptional regulator, transcriptional repressor for nem operon
MARVTKPEEFASKRNAILAATQRLVFTKGFAQMSIQDVLDALQISGGAFHHYFDSRGALLEALVEHIQRESVQPLLPIIHDPHLTAIQKLQGFLSALDRLRMARQQEVIEAARVWYTDGNAVVRQRVDEALLAQRAPLLTEVVRQGIQEGVFTTPFPDKAGEVIMVLLRGMGDTHARLLFTVAEDGDRPGRVEAIVATHAAYMDAIERVLGAPPNSLSRADAEAVMVWVAALRAAQLGQTRRNKGRNHDSISS